MRLFVAVNLSCQLQQIIAEFVKIIAPNATGVKWVNSSQAHLTLFFLGEQPISQISRLSPLLRSVADQNRIFFISLGGGGVFPSWTAPRILWLGVEEGKAALTLLANQVTEACCQTGIPKPGRPFTPHLTLGRVKASSAVVEAKTLTNGVDGRMLVEEFALIESKLTPQGPIYREIETYQLRSNP
ncbi:MAG TPA: RNA 2',3'-cyclic phosphodiesterase [Firmicutes bacterium]|jgi:2'-5' RNA ligase|nr:RNA 2',3'-cyclic phosphodiesterase [Bacillota bacterium]